MTRPDQISNGVAHVWRAVPERPLLADLRLPGATSSGGSELEVGAESPCPGWQGMCYGEGSSSEGRCSVLARMGFEWRSQRDRRLRAVEWYRVRTR
jgi:hypothetical protein